jgi:hypothetical protein
VLAKKLLDEISNDSLRRVGFERIGMAEGGDDNEAGIYERGTIE